MIVVVKEPAGSACETTLRVFEEKNLQLVFGDVVLCSPERCLEVVKATGARYVYWRPDTEKTNGTRWSYYCKIAKELDGLGIKHINHPDNLPFAQNKAVCFKRWFTEVIPTPDYFIYNSKERYYGGLNDYYIKPPFLVRLSNDNTGRSSVLVLHNSEIKSAFNQVESWASNPAFGGGITTNKLVVKFYPTNEPRYEYNYSYRIIVAADKVVAGYARVSRYDPTKRDSWVAITGKFSKHDGPAWFHYNRKCQEFMEENNDLIIQSVKCLGLNFQGVDVIIDRETQEPLFLEVQPGFSVGYPNHPGWGLPYYNPSYPELVKFIKDNIEQIQEVLPLYTIWLDKDKMFRHAFAALAKSFK